MATTQTEVNTTPSNSRPSTRSHRELLEAAYMHLAERERERDPELTAAKALARGVRILAREIRVSRESVTRMRARNRVAPWHWSNIERATGGHVTAGDFEQASHG